MLRTHGGTTFSLIILVFTLICRNEVKKQGKDIMWIKGAKTLNKLKEKKVGPR